MEKVKDFFAPNRRVSSVARKSGRRRFGAAYIDVAGTGDVEKEHKVTQTQDVTKIHITYCCIKKPQRYTRRSSQGNTTKRSQ